MLEKIVVAIPCYNEEATIEKVIKDFRNELPDAEIHVFDNNSGDKSAALANAAGAVMHTIRKKGKGNVLRAIFDAIDADALIIVDGDDTYAAHEVRELLKPVDKGEADMVVGNRLKNADRRSLANLRRLGNRMIVGTINATFRTEFEDVLSGYRAFNRRFIEMVPLLTQGFETETELTLQALEERMNIVEVPVLYKARPQDSESKLRPFNDGWRILMTIAWLLRDHHPIRIYGFVGAVCWTITGCALVLKITNYYQITALSDSLLATYIILFSLIGAIMFCLGFVLSAINTRFRELKQLMNRNKK